MSFSSSDKRLTFSVLPTPSDCISVDFGWVAAEKLAGCVVVGWVLKKATTDGNWKQRKLIKEFWNTFVSSMNCSCLASIHCSWLLSWRMWNGTASSEWACGADGGGVGTEPKGESGVDYLLSGVAGVEGSAFSDAGGVGITIWMDVASATSIFYMYSFLVQPDFSMVYLSTGRAGTTALRQREEMMQGEGWHQVLFHECIPQLRLGLEVWVVDGFWVLTLDIPLGALLAQLVRDCVKVFVFEDVNECIDARVFIWQVQNVVDYGGFGRHFPASYRYDVVAGSIIGIELHDPVQICSSWLSCKAEPAEIIQPLVDNRFKDIVLQVVIKEEPLFFPSILASNYSTITFSNCCATESRWHAFVGG
ncbi:hypothetical protein V6N13_053449 [Hibiscus sabdariffa]